MPQLQKTMMLKWTCLAIDHFIIKLIKIVFELYIYEQEISQSWNCKHRSNHITFDILAMVKLRSIHLLQSGESDDSLQGGYSRGLSAPLKNYRAQTTVRYILTNHWINTSIHILQCTVNVFHVYNIWGNMFL